MASLTQHCARLAIGRQALPTLCIWKFVRLSWLFLSMCLAVCAISDDSGGDPNLISAQRAFAVAHFRDLQQLSREYGRRRAFKHSMGDAARIIEEARFARRYERALIHYALDHKKITDLTPKGHELPCHSSALPSKVASACRRVTERDMKAFSRFQASFPPRDQQRSLLELVHSQDDMHIQTALGRDRQKPAGQWNLEMVLKTESPPVKVGEPQEIKSAYKAIKSMRGTELSMFSHLGLAALWDDTTNRVISEWRFRRGIKAYHDVQPIPEVPQPLHEVSRSPSASDSEMSYGDLREIMALHDGEILPQLTHSPPPPSARNPAPFPHPPVRLFNTGHFETLRQNDPAYFALGSEEQAMQDEERRHWPSAA